MLAWATGATYPWHAMIATSGRAFVSFRSDRIMEGPGFAIDYLIIDSASPTSAPTRPPQFETPAPTYTTVGALPNCTVAVAVLWLLLWPGWYILALRLSTADPPFSKAPSSRGISQCFCRCVRH